MLAMMLCHYLWVFWGVFISIFFNFSMDSIRSQREWFLCEEDDVLWMWGACFCSPHWHGSACANWVMKWINKKCGTESCALARWPKIQWRLAMFPVGLIQCGIQSVAQPVRIICTGLGLPLPYFSLKYRERERGREIAWMPRQMEWGFD